jgi:hypothetical protein
MDRHFAGLDANLAPLEERVAVRPFRVSEKLKELGGL